MNTTPTTESTALTTTGAAGALVGAGALTFALFPLAIPFLLLTAVFVAPLALVAIAAALPAAMVAGAVLGMRAMWRKRASRAPGSRGQSSRRDAEGWRRAQPGSDV
ncbi:MAG: hypothetical protein ACRDK9_13745 [Solirubrobacterales bacterium]